MNHIYSVGRNSYSMLGAFVVVAALALFPLASVSADQDKDKSNGKNGTSGGGVEVNLGANGSALVRGAKVTSVSGTTVNATTNYGSSQLSWRVMTDGNTEFTSHKGSTNGLANIAVGDSISFRGSLDQSVSGLTVKAKIVKDWSQVETKRTLEGVVSSINTTLGSFTISRNGSTSSPQATTVQTSSSTEWRGDANSFADLVLNASVKIKGFFNASTSVMTALSVAVDEDRDNDSDDDRWNKGDENELRNWIKSKVWLNWR